MTKPIETLSSTKVDVTRFEVREGTRKITCTVSDEALEAVSGLSAPSTPLLRRASFDRFRTLIDAAARLKAGTLPSGFVGSLALSSADLRRVPAQTGVPLFGTFPRAMARPAPNVEIAVAGQDTAAAMRSS